MKKAILFLILFSTNSLYGQISDREQAQIFWETNVQAIIQLDLQMILSQTHFPLKINTGKENWNKEVFKSKIPMVFNEKIRKELSKEDIDFIDAWIMMDDLSDTYMLTFLYPTETYEAVVFSFKQFNGKWELYGIDYHLE